MRLYGERRKHGTPACPCQGKRAVGGFPLRLQGQRRTKALNVRRSPAPTIPQPSADLIRTLRRELEERLEPRRFAHVMGVEAFAVALATRFGADPERALLAALLHDYCKNDPKESQRRAAERCRAVATTPEDLACKPIWHGFAAADVAAERFGITDREVLEAIAFHPTGDPGFGPIGLVLYTADHIEPGRDFDGVNALRPAVFAAPTLREAALPVAETRFAHLQQDGRPVHPRTRALLESLRQPLPTHPHTPRSLVTP